MRVLRLSVSRMPFDVMVTGEKKTEYRDPSSWMMSRLADKHYDIVRFTNGCGRHRPYFDAKFIGWEVEENPSAHSFSNGLTVETKIGTIKIHLGEITERCNIKGVGNGN